MKAKTINKKDIKTYVKIILQSSLLIICGLVLLQISLSLLKRVGINIGIDSTLGNVLLELVVLGSSLLVVIHHYKTKVLEHLSMKYIHQQSIRQVLIGIAIGAIGILVIYLILFMTKIIYYKGSGFEFYHSDEVGIFTMQIFIRTFFAGLCEEVYFRGLLQNYLTKLTNQMAGLIISSIIFALLHCSRYNDLIQLSTVLLSGITLGYIYQKTKSIYLSIGLHIATDFFINLPAPIDQLSLFVFQINSNYSVNSLSQIIFILCSSFYLVTLIVFYIRDRKKA